MTRTAFLNLLVSAASLIAIPIHAQNSGEKQNSAENDKSTQLDELVVKAKKGWFENGKAVFIPEKREKNLAKDATSLIDRMNTGVLHVEKGSIKTYNNEDVAIYINGVKADDMDLSTFWPKNALRVEFIPVDSNSEFSDSRNILNFIMRDYTVGGLTKLEADQVFPNEGSYSASSKFVYGLMAYNAIFKGGYMRDHLQESDFTETYDDVWYDGVKYDRIVNEEHSESYSRKNDIYGGFNARYRKEKWTITHTAALQWNQNPGSGANGIGLYTPSIFPDNASVAKTDSRSLIPALTGSYNFMDNARWRFGIFWSFRYARNDLNIWSRESTLDPIANRSKEDLYNYLLTVWGGFKLNRKMVFQLYLKGIRNLSDTEYTGYTASRQWQSFGKSNITLYWYYLPLDNLTITATPSIDLYDYNVNHMSKRTEWIPGMDLRIFYDINTRNSISLEGRYIQISPASSVRNDLILRQSELKWLEGNPSISPAQMGDVSLSYRSRPADIFNTTLTLRYILDHNESAIGYRSGGPEYDGIIGTYINGKNNHSVMTQWDASLSMLDGNLRLGNSLTYTFFKSATLGTLNNVRTRAHLSWYFGNCSLMAYYNTPEKYFANAGTRQIRTHHDYGLDFSYGNGNFIFDVEIANPFNKRLSTKELVANGPYISRSINWERGRNVRVTLTYTFDYGMKVSPSIEIAPENLRSSSVLGSE